MPAKIRQRTIKALDGFGTSVSFACFLVLYKNGPNQRSLSPSIYSGGTAHGFTEEDDDVDDVEGDEEVLQLISLIDSRCRPEGFSEARCKTTGARAEARAVGTTQPLAPEVSLK